MYNLTTISYAILKSFLIIKEEMQIIWVKLNKLNLPFSLSLTDI